MLPLRGVAVLTGDGDGAAFATVDNGGALRIWDAELRHLLTEARPTKTCDEVDWALFGVSMATYNVATSLALAVVSFWGAEKIRRQT